MDFKISPRYTLVLVPYPSKTPNTWEIRINNKAVLGSVTLVFPGRFHFTVCPMSNWGLGEFGHFDGGSLEEVSRKAFAQAVAIAEVQS